MAFMKDILTHNIPIWEEWKMETLKRLHRVKV